MQWSWNEWGAASLLFFNQEQMSLFVTWADLLCVSTSSLSFTILFWPSQFLPLPPSLSTSFLPWRLLSASQHIPPGGEGCLIRASSNLPLSFLSQPVLPFSGLLSVDSLLSYTSSLHYLPSSPSSKMTFADFTQACQFELAAVDKGKWKDATKRNNRVWRMTSEGQKESVSSVIAHHWSPSCGY